MSRWLRFARVVFFAIAVAAPRAEAVPLRIAAWNVLYGVGKPGSNDYNAVKAILQRVNPDIIGFEELTDSDYNNWVTLAAELGYPYLAYSSGGPFAGASRLGFMSRHRIVAAYEVREPTGAVEFTRWPLHAIFEVPGALNRFHVWVVHNKASSGDVNQFRRAIEIMRAVSNIAAWAATYPLETEYVIMGDFNEDVTASQVPFFYTLPADLPTDYVLGSDIVFPVKYRLYPTDRPAEVFMEQLNIFQEDSNIAATYQSGSRLDYLFFSDDIMSSPYGAPVGEVYNSARDDGVGGLPKYGSPLPTNTSALASDHYLIFADIHLIDALPCLNAVALISEVVHHPTTPGASYVELYNSGVNAMNLTNYQLIVYRDGATPLAIPLAGTLGAGATWTIAASTSGFYSVWGKWPTMAHTNLLQLNGNDVCALRNSAGLVVDIYGVPGEPTGSNDYALAWAYRSNAVYRKVGVCDPLSYWSSNEWVWVSYSQGTPGSHVACNQAGVYGANLRLIPSAPFHTSAISIAVSLYPNLPAGGLSATAYYRLEGGTWTSATMTAGSSNHWQTATLPIQPRAGDTLRYYVACTFTGANANPPYVTVTNAYVFPVPPGSVPQPLFNEVRADDAGTDDIEFFEIIAPAGMNLQGYKVVHYNGAETSDDLIFTFMFPSFVVPNDGVYSTNGTALGFVVVGMNNPTNPIPNLDFVLPAGGLQNGPDGLVLYDPAGNIVDAVAWEGPGDLITDNPGTVTTNPPPWAPNYLHVLPDDSSDDRSLQAPNNVLYNTGNWSLAAATPGTLNAGQTSGSLIVSLDDRDGDGFLDVEDNCPGIFNPIQADTDRDGVGDECDPDLDGDGRSNDQDNCPYVYNPSQSDQDLDGIGDECDYDRDGDGIENDEDNCPNSYNPSQADMDGDGVGDPCDADRDGDAISNAADNCPEVYNPLQADNDSDGQGDPCDSDDDNDGVPDELDNCPWTFNPFQEDANGDGIGDACVVDADNDGVDDRLDNCPAVYNPSQQDLDRDGLGDACDPCVGGYAMSNYLFETFSSGVLPPGWSTVSAVRASWRFDNPLGRTNLTGGSGGMAIAESRAYPTITMDVELRTPPLNLAGAETVELEFKTDFDWYPAGRSETCDVDVSRSGPLGPWSNVWRKAGNDYRGPATEKLDLTSLAAGHTNVIIRFRYCNARNEMYWQVDDVVVRGRICDVNFDGDGDGIPDIQDNCPFVFNPNQNDFDQDGYGDACDADRDGDGIPDAWEMQAGLSTNVNNFAVDSDADGMTDYQEYVADTRPLDAGSRLVLHAQVPTGQTARLAFPGSAQRRYQLLYKPPPLTGTGAWQYAGAPFWGSTGLTLVVDTNFASAAVTTRYYRLRVLRP